FAKGFCHGFQLGDVTGRGAGAVSIQIINGRVAGHGQGFAHTADRAFTGRGDHIGTVGSGGVTNQFGINSGTTFYRVFVFFQYQHAAAAGDDKAVTVGVVRAGSAFRAVVVFARQGAHGVKLGGQGPVFFFTATGEDDVLLVPLNQLHTVANTMRTGGAGGGHGVVHTFYREGRGQVGRDGAAHGAGNAVRADFADAFFTQNIDGLHNVAGGSAAGTGHQAGARVADHLFSETGIGNGFTHGQIGVSGRVAHKAFQFAVDDFVEVNLWFAGHMAAQAQFGVFRHKADT